MERYGDYSVPKISKNVAVAGGVRILPNNLRFPMERIITEKA